MEGLSFATKFGNSLLVMVIGLVVVFIGLLALIVICWLMGRLIGIKKAKAPAESEKIQAEPAAPEIEPEQYVQDNDEETVAAIMAAITLVMAQGGVAKGGFTVRRVRRVGASSQWGKAGREELLSSKSFN